MNKDFRLYCFEELFNNDLDNLVVQENVLSNNQSLRAKQLILNTKENIERINNSISTYSENWSFERIGNVEKITLQLGI